MPSNTEKRASQAYWIGGRGHVMPIQPGTMEAGEMAHVQGLYAGITYASGHLATTAGGSDTFYVTVTRRRR